MKQHTGLCPRHNQQFIDLWESFGRKHLSLFGYFISIFVIFLFSLRGKVKGQCTLIFEVSRGSLGLTKTEAFVNRWVKPVLCYITHTVAQHRNSYSQGSGRILNTV